MQLFSKQINDIQAKIKALQAQRDKLQDLENATASSLANLKAVVANIKDDVDATATLKSAINSLFEPYNSSPKTVNERDNDFTYEFNSKDYAQRFVEMCKCRGDVDCQEYKLENTTVTVINHNEDDDLLMRLATDIENDAYSSDASTEQTQDKATENDAEISNQIVCDDKAQAMKMCQHFKNSDLIIDCQISNDELAVEFSFKKTDSDLVGKLVYEFESNCTARNAPGCAKSDLKSDLYRADESALAVIHERELRLPAMAVKVAQLVKEHYHKVEVKNSKFIGTKRRKMEDGRRKKGDSDLSATVDRQVEDNDKSIKPTRTKVEELLPSSLNPLPSSLQGGSLDNPHHFSETQLDEIISEFNSRKPIQLSEQAQWDSQTDVLYIWFKLKKTLKIWAEHYNVAYEDAIVRDQSDSSKEGYKYLLTVLRYANVDHTEWMTQQGQFDFSKTPQENRQQLIEDSKQQLYTEKYHILIQKNQESETVEIESSDEAYARKKYSSLVESIPDSYIHLMSNKRGCLETHKPPALSFMAAGMGWLNVIHKGEVLGVIYSDKTGWELETGEKFETREEAALAMLNLSSVAA